MLSQASYAQKSDMHNIFKNWENKGPNEVHRHNRNKKAFDHYIPQNKKYIYTNKRLYKNTSAIKKKKKKKKTP